MSLSMLGTGIITSKSVGDAVDVSFSADSLVVTLADGRTVSAPLEWFPRLLRATAGQWLRHAYVGDQRVAQAFAPARVGELATLGEERGLRFSGTPVTDGSIRFTIRRAQEA